MKAKILLLFILMFSPFLFGKKLMLATCEMGNGCTFQLSEVNAYEYDIIEGTDGYYEGLPESAIVVDGKIEGNWERYIETKKTRAELDRFYGGDGFTMIYPFNPDFQPLDGLWKVQFGTVVGDVCYGQQSNLFKSMLQGKTQSGNINFPRPFQARFMMDSPHVKWIKVAPNKYRGYFGESVMNVTYDVQLINAGKIEGLFTVTIEVPTKEDCINKIPVMLTCVKPNEWEDPWDLLEDPGPHVPLIEDDPSPDVPYLNDADEDLLDINNDYKDNPGNHPDVEIIKDLTKPNVPIIED